MYVCKLVTIHVITAHGSRVEAAKMAIPLTMGHAYLISHVIQHAHSVE